MWSIIKFSAFIKFFDFDLAFTFFCSWKYSQVEGNKTKRKKYEKQIWEWDSNPWNPSILDPGSIPLDHMRLKIFCSDKEICSANLQIEPELQRLFSELPLPVWAQWHPFQSNRLWTEICLPLYSGISQPKNWSPTIIKELQLHIWAIYWQAKVHRWWRLLSGKGNRKSES